LEAHNTAEFFFFAAPEFHTIVHFPAQLLSRHVRFFPTIGRDHTIVGAGAIVDDLPDKIEVTFGAAADHG